MWAARAYLRSSPVGDSRSRPIADNAVAGEAHTMSSRVTDLLLGAALAAFSTASFGAAFGNTALFAYAATAGLLLGVASKSIGAVWKGRRRHYDPVFPKPWNAVLTVTDIVFVLLILLGLTLDLRAPEPVYWLGAIALMVSVASRLLPAFRS